MLVLVLVLVLVVLVLVLVVLVVLVVLINYELFKCTSSLLSQASNHDSMVSSHTS